MARKTEIVSVSDWKDIVARLDGDLQLSLGEYLSNWVENTHVEYMTDTTGRIDSDSCPRYCDGSEYELV